MHVANTVINTLALQCIAFMAMIRYARLRSIALCAVLLACALADTSDAQTQISDLCGTSNMQSFAGNSYVGTPAARITNAVCRPDENGFRIDIFNGIESISCNNVDNDVLSSNVFSVQMYCTGTENNGDITGSLQVSTNDSTSTTTSLITIPLGVTKSNLLVKLDNDDISISGRQCILQPFVELFARNPDTGICTSCQDQPGPALSQNCGAIGTKDDGNIGESVWLWLVIDVLIIGAAIVTPLLVDYDDERDANRLRAKVDVARRQNDIVPGDVFKTSLDNLEQRAGMDKTEAAQRREFSERAEAASSGDAVRVGGRTKRLGNNKYSRF